VKAVRHGGKHESPNEPFLSCRMVHNSTVAFYMSLCIDPDCGFFVINVEILILVKGALSVDRLFRFLLSVINPYIG
jgi:hypothetical protein